MRVKREDAMEIMRELAGNDVRLALFFLDTLKEKIAPYYENRLSLKCEHVVRLGTGPAEEVMAIIESVPNPIWGKAPCCFEEPVVMVSKEMRDGKFVLNFTQAIYRNYDIRYVLREIKEDFEKEDGLTFSCFMFKKT